MKLDDLKQLLKLLNEQNVVLYEVDGVKLQLIPSGPQLPPQVQETIDEDLLFYSSENN
jgi:hypothetical protein